MNNITVMGRLVAEPTSKEVNDSTIVNFAVAVSRGDAKRTTDFLDCVAFGKTGEFIFNNFRKGQMITFSGSVQTHSYDDKDGRRRKAYQITAERAEFCASKAETAAGEAHRSEAGAKQTEQNTETVADDEDTPF